MKPPSRAIFWMILGSFFVSGVAGLIYQVVWTRYLALFLGHTSYAVVAVLVAFMGGLALGNAWLGAKADQLKRPLLFYAWLEIGIGLYAVLFPLYYEWVHAGYLSIVRSTGVSGGALLGVKFAFAGFAILPPTLLMGATLPVLTKFVTRTLSELRGKVAALYAINSTGAVVGTLLADWWWIPTIGLQSVVHAGAAMSLGVGLVAWVLSRMSQEGEGAPETAPPVENSTTTEQFTPRELRAAIWGIGISGFVAMLYEVAWTRLLALAIGSSTHAYSLMLVTFISGIAVGSWCIYRWKAPGRTLAAFAWAEMALGLTLLVSLPFYDILPWGFATFADMLSRNPRSYLVYELLQGLLCFLVMFVPAVCLGTTLPLVSRVATAELARTGRSVGMVFAVNTIGTVLGAALTGLVLLPNLGLSRTFALGIAGNFMVSAMAFMSRRSATPTAHLWAGPAFAALIALIAGQSLNDRWQRAFATGVWRMPSVPANLKQYREWNQRLKLVYHRDAAGSTVVVVDGKDSSGRDVRSLRVNGKTDASSGTDMTTQLLTAHIPLLLHGASPDVLVVGCGSGVTVGAALSHPQVRHLDLVEISPEVVEAATLHFSDLNQGAMKDPRTHLVIDDAKSFLKTTRRDYDVIVTEPSNPWMAGVASVFSREFYEDCRSRLKPGGLIGQWLQVYETDDATLETVVATFGTVFPYLSIWQTSAGDLLLVGAVEAPKIDPEEVAKRFRQPTVEADLARVQLLQPSVLFSLQHLDFEDGVHLPFLETRIHSDFYPTLEYLAQRAFFVRNQATRHMKMSELFSVRPRTMLGQWMQTHPFTVEDYRALGRFFTTHSIMDIELERSLLFGWLAADPENKEILHFLNNLASLSQGADAEAERLSARPEYQLPGVLDDPTILREYSGLLWLKYRAKRSAFYRPSTLETEQALASAADLDTANRRTHLMRLAELVWDRGDEARFTQLVRQSLDPDTRNGPVVASAYSHGARLLLGRMIDLFVRRGEWTDAWNWSKTAADNGLLVGTEAEHNHRLNVLTRRVAAVMNNQAKKTNPPN